MSDVEVSKEQQKVEVSAEELQQLRAVAERNKELERQKQLQQDKVFYIDHPKQCEQEAKLLSSVFREWFIKECRAEFTDYFMKLDTMLPGWIENRGQEGEMRDKIQRKCEDVIKANTKGYPFRMTMFLSSWLPAGSNTLVEKPTEEKRFNHKVFMNFVYNNVKLNPKEPMPGFDSPLKKYVHPDRYNDIGFMISVQVDIGRYDVVKTSKR